MDTIERFDIVEYISRGYTYEGGIKKTADIPIQGTWDGEKVIFPGPEHLTVRKKDWLKLIKKIDNIIYFDKDNCNCLTIENKKGQKHYIVIPPGKNRVDIYSTKKLPSTHYLYNAETWTIISTDTERLCYDEFNKIIAKTTFK
jgi:hypothetical protein